MSKVYKVNNGDSGATKLPSIDYINELVKMIEDQMKYPKDDFSGFPSIKEDTESLPIGVEEIPTVSAKEIKTDSQHKFINDAILATIADKPSKFEIEQTLSSSKEELKKYIEDVYTRILNTPNVINKLRDISTVLNEDEISAGLLNTLSYKLNTEDFKEHTKSSTHMTNNDRKALNILLKCLLNGFSDWNADENDYNVIKNKPESLPANGGNADTIANHGIRELLNNNDYDIVIGRSDKRYSEDCCDIYSEDGTLTNKTIQDIVTDSSLVHFKRGYYNIDRLYAMYANGVIFSGVTNKLTILHATEASIKMSNMTFENIGFDDSNIIITGECNLKNVRFMDCKIVISNAEACNITDCIFENCTIEYKGYIKNSIIKFNRFIRTTPIKYLGGNNIISENI